MTSTRAPVDAWIRLHPQRPLAGTSKYPRRQVVVEYKPHNRAGIRGGIAQLRSRPEAKTLQPRLVTYERTGPNRFVVRIIDPAKVMAAVRKPLRSLSAAEFPTTRDAVDIGWFSLPPEILNRTLRLVKCPTKLGVEVERFVDKTYSRWIGIEHASRKANATGADRIHETADFLRELAFELEASL